MHPHLQISYRRSGGTHPGIGANATGFVRAVGHLKINEIEPSIPARNLSRWFDFDPFVNKASILYGSCSAGFSNCPTLFLKNAQDQIPERQLIPMERSEADSPESPSPGHSRAPYSQLATTIECSRRTSSRSRSMAERCLSVPLGLTSQLQ